MPVAAMSAISLLNASKLFVTEHAPCRQGFYSQILRLLKGPAYLIENDLIEIEIEIN